MYWVGQRRSEWRDADPAVMPQAVQTDEVALEPRYRSILAGHRQFQE
jgi:hypothetical protein